MERHSILFALALMILGPAAAGAGGTGSDDDLPPLPRGRSNLEVELQVFPGFDPGYFLYRTGSWTPVLVRIHNSSDRELAGTLVLSPVDQLQIRRGGSQTSLKATVPPRSRRDFRFLIHPVEGDREYLVSFRDALSGTPLCTPGYSGGGRPLDAREHYTLVIISRDKRARSGSSRPSTHTFLVVDPAHPRAISTPPPGLLPENPLGYDAVGSVIVQDPRVLRELSAAQAQALLTWVAAGGHLVVETPSDLDGPDALDVPGLGAIMPVRGWHRRGHGRSGPHSHWGSVPGLVDRIPLLDPPGTVPKDLEDIFAAPLRLDPGQTDLPVPGGVEALRKPWGLGSVVWTGLDLTLLDRSNRDDLREIQDSLDILLGLRTFDPPALGAGDWGFSSLERGVSEDFQRHGLEQVPDSSTLLGFLFAYCLLLGPVNLLLLGRGKRRMLAWKIGVPLLVCLFTILSMVSLRPHHANHPMIQEVSVMRFQGGSRISAVDSIFSVYSPVVADARVTTALDPVGMSWTGSEVRGLDREAIQYDTATPGIDQVRLYSHSTGIFKAKGILASKTIPFKVILLENKPPRARVRLENGPYALEGFGFLIRDGTDGRMGIVPGPRIPPGAIQEYTVELYSDRSGIGPMGFPMSPDLRIDYQVDSFLMGLRGREVAMAMTRTGVLNPRLELLKAIGGAGVAPTVTEVAETLLITDLVREDRH